MTLEFWTQIAFCMGEEEKTHEKAAKRLRQTHASGLLGGFLVQTAYAYQCRDCGKVAYSHSERDGFADSSFVLGLTLLPQAKQTLQDIVDEYQAPRPLLEYVCPDKCHANQQRVDQRRHEQRSQPRRTRARPSEQPTATRDTRSSTARRVAEPEGQEASVLRSTAGPVVLQLGRWDDYGRKNTTPVSVEAFPPWMAFQEGLGPLREVLAKEGMWKLYRSFEEASDW